MKVKGYAKISGSYDTIIQFVNHNKTCQQVKHQDQISLLICQLTESCNFQASKCLLLREENIQGHEGKNHESTHP